jgi:ABC-type oligopeptide transport system ATPase subunit
MQFIRRRKVELGGKMRILNILESQQFKIRIGLLLSALSLSNLNTMSKRMRIILVQLRNCRFRRQGFTVL